MTGSVPGGVGLVAWASRAWRRSSRQTLFWLAACVVGGYLCTEAFAGWAADRQANYSLAAWVFTLITVASMAPLVMIADEAVVDGRSAWLCYGIALVAGAALTVILTNVAKPLIHFNVDDPWLVESPWWEKLQSTAWWFFGFLGDTTLAVLVYVNLRTARLADERRREAELARARARRRTLESRLQAMQARVEPQFLFNTLAQVKQLYELDTPLAERMLDDLITYLRAAMPHMRDTASTVAQEVELARAYLDIVKLRLGDQLAVEIDMPLETTACRMPPMVLLPLIDHALVHGLGPPRSGGALRIACQVEQGKLRVVITDSGAGFVPEAAGDGIASIRERLVALYGKSARLELWHAAAQASYALMEIPIEEAAYVADVDVAEPGLAAAAR
jgi:hypothetical protein